MFCITNYIVDFGIQAAALIKILSSSFLIL